MPRIRKIDRTRTKKEDRKKAAPPASKNEALSTNDTKPAAKQDRNGNSQPTNSREAPQHDIKASESIEKDTEQRDLVDDSSKDNEGLAKESPPKAKAKTRKKGRKNARKKPPVKKLKKVIKKPKKTPPKPKLDEDSFDSADDQISDESHDDSKDEDFDANFMEQEEDEDEASNESFIESSDADVTPKRKRPRRRSVSKHENRRSRRTHARERGDTSSEDDSVPKRKRPRRRPVASAKWSESSSEEEIVSRPSRSRRPSDGNGGLELKDTFSEDDRTSEDSAPLSQSHSRCHNAKNRGVGENASEYDDSDSSQKKARRKSALKARAARARKSRSQTGGLAESEKSYSDDGGPGCAPKVYPRASARKASAKLALYAGNSNDEDYELYSSKKGHREDSEEFVLDNEADEVSDEEFSGSSEIPDVHVGKKMKAADDIGSAIEEASDDKKAGYVNGEDIGTAEDSGSDGEDPPYKSPELKLKRLPTESPKIANRLFEDDSDSSENSSHKLTTASPPRMPPCDSEVDVITDEPLPEIHVCYFPPDGESRQCFALETLRRIAITTEHPKYRETLSGEELTFLQPPHFRSVMSDELLDQIASRFGRDALDINGPYYRRDAGRPAAAAAFRLGNGSAEDDDDDDARFMMRVKKYAQGMMGNQDLYVCPLCYAVAHQRLSEQNHRMWSGRGRNGKKGRQQDDSDDEDDKLSKKYPLDFSYDPMSILGSPDGEKCEIASFFCFKKASEVKAHLRNDHNVDTRIVEGNDLYARFKIRAQDGLLQRYIKKECGFGISKQGYLQQYWFGGNNFEFVHLLSLIRHAARCRELVKTQEAYLEAVTTTDAFGRTKILERGLKREDAEEYFQSAFDFFCSFVDLAPKLWELIAAPYTQDKQDIKDFIEESEVEDDGETGAMYRAAEMQAFRDSLDSDQQRVEYLRSQEADYLKGSDDEHEAASDNHDGLMDSTQSDVAAGSEDDVANGGYFEESSSEEDDWMQKKRESLGARRRQSRGKNDDRKQLAKLKKESSGQDSESEVEFETKAAAPPSAESRSRRAIGDSDDE